MRSWKPLLTLFAAIGAFAASYSALASGETVGSLLYGQSAEFWSSIHSITSAQGSLTRIDEVLNNKHGTFEEVVSRIHVRHRSEDYYIEAAAEGVGTGELRNRVISELNVRILGMGTISGGITTASPDRTWELSGGANAGLGSTKHATAVGSDLIEKLALQNDRVAMLGPDLAASHRLGLGGEWTLQTSASYHGSAFFTSNQDTLFTHRWRLSVEGKNETLGFHAIASPQPLPIDLLPRTWEYVHDVYPFPELAATLGAGASLRFTPNKEFSISGLAGYYAGFPGGTLEFAYQGTKLRLSSFELTASTDFQGLSQRLWMGTLELRF